MSPVEAYGARLRQPMGALQMPKFGARSLAFLNECHPQLIKVANDAIKTYDFSIICGYRDRVNQEAAFKSGASKARFGQSPHNYRPAYAFDATPYPLDWKDIKAFEAMGKVIMASADRLNIAVTWGKDFKGLVDYPHFELTGWRNMIRD